MGMATPIVSQDTPEPVTTASTTTTATTTTSIGQPTQIDPNSSEQWRNRRRMAYIAIASMVSMMAVLLCPIVSVERVMAIENVAEWFLITCGSIVAAYTGFATYSAVKLSQPK